jgi:hypothetical protein
MIPTTENTTTQSNIDGHKIQMRFDEDSLVHLMSLLTNAYTDPELAVVREYSTNARDSHIEAGQTRAIEVETPSALKPVLIVRDFGIGLSEQDIEQVYSLYGASTKRDTNDQVGALGIGGKSALAYTDQFTVVGVKDGVRTVVSVSRDEDGAGTMTIVETLPTDEDNGVEIMVPCHRHSDFDEKAKAFFRYWPKGSVLLNGKEPDHIDGLKLTDRIMLVEREGFYDKSVVVMGNIPYEIPSEIEPLKGALNGRRVVATVPIGDVHFAPSRETLQLTGRTKKRMEALNEEAQSALAVSIQTDIDSAPDKVEALRKATAWRRTFDRQQLSAATVQSIDSLAYKGEPVPKSLQMPTHKNEKGEDVRPKLKVTSKSGHKLSETDSAQYKYIEAITALQSILVTGYTADSFIPSHKKKLVVYSDQQEIGGNHYVLLNGTMPENVDWFDVPVIKWEDVKLIKLDRTAINVEGSRKTLLGSYDVHDGGRMTHEKQASELEGDLYYYTPQTYEGYGYSKRKQERAERVQAELFKAYRPDAMLIRLGLNRIAKFKRDFPQGKEAHPELTVMHDELVKSLGEDDKQALAQHDHGDTSKLEELDPDLIEDPDLKRAIELANMDVSVLSNKLKPFQEPCLKLTPKSVSPKEQAYKLADHYPIVEQVEAWRYGRGKDAEKLRWHMYIYLNATYEVEQELAAGKEASNQTIVQSA